MKSFSKRLKAPFCYFINIFCFFIIYNTFADDNNQAPMDLACSGFAIIDFQNAAPMLLLQGNGTQASIDKNKLKLNDASVIWRESKFNVEDGFETSITFKTSRLNSDENWALTINEQLMIGVDDYGKLKADYGIHDENQVSLSTNVFDGATHTITFSCKAVKTTVSEKVFTATLSVDNGPIQKFKFPFIRTTERNEGGERFWYINPSIIAGDRAGECVIYSWSFKNHEGHRILGDQEFSKYSSYLEVNYRRYQVRNQVTDQITNIHRAYTSGEHPGQDDFGLFKEQIGTTYPYATLGYTEPFAKDLTTSTVNVSVYNLNPDKGIDPQAQLQSVDPIDSKRVTISNVVRYDGTIGKEVTILDAGIKEHVLTNKERSVSFSGKFYIWASQPTPSKEESAKALNMRNFCGHYLQDNFEAKHSKYHEYDVETVICNKTDNPYCTVKNVFNHMVSDINYLAPANASGLMLSPGFASYYNNETGSSGLTGNLSEFRPLADALKRRTTGNKVCDCKEAILLGYGDVDAPSRDFVDYLKSLVNFQGVNVQGVIEMFNSSNPIIINVDQKQFSITNRTLNGHFLHPGKITRTIIEDGNVIKVHTLGVGMTAKSTTNDIMGNIFFKIIDVNLKLDFSLIMHSKESQLKIKNVICP